jgi:hypothetical protein
MANANAVKPLPGAQANPDVAPGTGAAMRPNTEEGLQLFKAFVKIEDPVLRRNIISMVELLAQRRAP